MSNTEMQCTDARDLLNGYLDNELDAAHALQVARHLESCEACRSAHAVDVGLRAALRDNAPRYRAPAPLRTKILASIGGSAKPTRARDWLGTGEGTRLGAAFAFAVLVTFGVTYYFVKPSASDLLMEEALATHVRGVLSTRPIDVASSDRHTVKPWLSARLDFSPPVADFTEQGFALAGGRLDYLDGRPIATLIYQHKQHVISVFVWPDATAGPAGSTYESKRGYNLARWTRGGFRYYAVSDVSVESLRHFVALLQGEK
jgi:anti-sigma factor (TIGR02949 family)